MSTPSDPNPQDRPAHDPTPGYGQPAAPGYNQPGHEQGGPGGYGGAPAPSNGTGVAALVLGIIALLFCWVPFLGGVIAIVGIILGFIARGKVKRGQATNGGMAITGLILSVVALLINIAFVVLTVVLVNEVGGNLEEVQNCAELPVEEQQACIEELTNN